MEFTIDTKNKPHLDRAMQENPQLARAVIQTFVGLMDEAFDPSKTITWAELPKKLHEDLDFGSLIRGILRGSLDLHSIHPEAADVLREEVHPLAMLQKRKNYLDGGERYVNWRGHFGLSKEAMVNEKTVADIFRKLLRYSRYVKIDELRKAHEANQVAAFRGMGDEQVMLLPFYPALRYQREHFGDLQVGKFMDDLGSFDCGPMPNEHDWDICPACGHVDSMEVMGSVSYCMDCNAGFRKEG